MKIGKIGTQIKYRKPFSQMIPETMPKHLGSMEVLTVELMEAGTILVDNIPRVYNVIRVIDKEDASK